MSNKPRYTERELIQRAIQMAKPAFQHQSRWVMVKRVFGTGSTVSAEICREHGYDPDEEVSPIWANDFDEEGEA